MFASLKLQLVTWPHQDFIKTSFFKNSSSLDWAKMCYDFEEKKSTELNNFYRFYGYFSILHGNLVINIAARSNLII